MIRAARFALAILCLATMLACGGGEPAGNSGPASASGESVQRIVTLSPHLAELVFAVGAGDLLVGVSAFTDYPDEAAALPLVGDAFNVDHEQLALLEPDLLLAWSTGTPAHVVDDLRDRGFRVETVTTIGLADVPIALRRIGALTGRVDAAAKAAATFEDGLRRLAEQASGAGTISVFYQVDARPLYTINGDHYVSELIGTCGGSNIFSDLKGLAPLVSFEAVLERNPEVILASTDAGPVAFDAWKRWQDIAANRYGNFFLMPANEIGRATPRLLTAAKSVCDALQQGRRNREMLSND